MEIFIDPKSPTPLTKQIYEEIRGAVLDGRFAPGDRLPPSRELAETLGVSRHTITTAYGQLTGEGFLTGRQGGGTVVAEWLTPPRAIPKERLPEDVPAETQMAEIRWDLRPGFPDPRLYPLAEWKRYTKWAVDAHEISYGDPAGNIDLRRALARSVGRSRGIDAGPDDVLVTAGAQQAFYMITGAFVAKGETVAMEDPGYDQFRELLRALNIEVTPVPVDGDGIVVDQIPADARVVYVTPSHQFPVGVTMSLERRFELLELAAAQEMLIIEDDYDSEFRYVDRPLEPLYRLDRAGSVVYVGTFSKTLSPGLRLGYVIGPPHLIGPLTSMRMHIDWAPPDVDQRTLRYFIADGAFDRHLRKAKKEYVWRHQKVTSMADSLAPMLESPRSNAGLHVAAYLNPDISERAVVKDLGALGVAVAGFERYRADPSATPQGLVFGFGQVGGDELEQALQLIAATVQEA